MTGHRRAIEQALVVAVHVDAQLPMSAVELMRQRGNDAVEAECGFRIAVQVHDVGAGRVDKTGEPGRRRVDEGRNPGAAHRGLTLLGLPAIERHQHIFARHRRIDLPADAGDVRGRCGPPAGRRNRCCRWRDEGSPAPPRRRGR
jgi:hypothetical protein